MSFIGAALHETAEYPSHRESLATFANHLDPAWIEAALEATGSATLRRRKLPAEQVVWLVIGMALERDRPIAEMVERLDLVLPGADGSMVVASSSVVQARQRVGAEPLAWLFERCGREWAHSSAREHAWNGLSLYAVDGTSLRVADSKENRAHFGGANGPRGESGYPMVRMAALMAVRSHLLAAVQFGPFAISEHELSEDLWRHIPDHSLTILDRNFLAAYILVGALQSEGTNRHWLTRAKSTTKWKVVKSFSQRDKLVELKVTSNARAKDPTLPLTFTARAVRYQHRGSRGQQWLLTSLIDPAVSSAKDLVAVYHERWEIELGYDEIKTHMLEREETIRSRTVETVEQEIWGILLCYNLIRVEMERIAAEAGVPPSRISFVTAMRFIRDEWIWCAIASPGSIPKKLQRMRQRVAAFVLPPRRSKRRYPRAVKVKMSNYAKKRTPGGKQALK